VLPLSRQPKIKPAPRRAAGFTLVEIMVGMVIGLLGIIVMMNVFSIFESQKRTTGGGSEVQNTGAITLFGLQHEVQQAGYAISSPNLIGCNVTMSNGYTIPFAPVIINPAVSVIPAGDTNTDTLLVTYGNTNGETEGDVILTGNPAGAATYNIYAVKVPTAFHLNDQVIAEPTALPSNPLTAPAPCNLAVDSVVGVGPTTVSVLNGISSVSFINAANGSGTLFNIGNPTNGNALRVHAYAIRGGNLTVCDYTVNNCGDPTQTNVSTVWLPIGNDIPIMRAIYERDTNTAPMNGIADTYDQSTPTTACTWERTSALRIALVGRNNQPLPSADAATINAVAPTWSGNAAAPINLAGTNANLPPGMTWQNYRYKVFETSMPIRNIVLNGVVPGC